MAKQTEIIVRLWGGLVNDICSNNPNVTVSVIELDSGSLCFNSEEEENHYKKLKEKLEKKVHSKEFNDVDDTYIYL